MKLIVETQRLGPFMGLLEEGVRIEVPEGLSVRDVLVDTFKMDPLYLEERVLTLFLNGNPVDDVDAVFVGKDAVLALSGAMPGLVGATMRRDGRLAGMRQRIDSASPASGSPGAPVRVTVKLFNRVARERGEALFKDGIRVPGPRLHRFLQDREERLMPVCTRIAVDGSPVSWPALLSKAFGEGDVFLKVTLAPS